MQPAGDIDERFLQRNIFSALPGYYRIAYSHNGWVNTLLEQLRGALDEFIPWNRLFLNSIGNSIPALFRNDSDIASVGWIRNMDVDVEGFAYSLFLSRLNSELVKRRNRDLLKQFPRGLPATGNVGSQFILEDAIGWVAKRLPVIPRPFLGYFHFLPPHGPYNTSLKFFNHFAGDGFHPLEKPEDIFSRKMSGATLLKQRLEYDEFILYVDEQFGRFVDALDASGLLGDTWVFLTSDHGELHERGISGHSTYGLYEPVVRVPLLIFEPGRITGQDVFTPTSAADLLPTIMKLAGAPAPDWSDGIILPPFAAPASESQRSVYAVQAEKTGMHEKITRASVILVKDRYKLLDYFGYEGNGTGEFLRLFDIQSDPEEMNDLAETRPELVKELLEELKKRVAEVNKPYS